MDKAELQWKQIEKFLEAHGFIVNADVCSLQYIRRKGKSNSCRTCSVGDAYSMLRERTLGIYS